MTEQTTDASIVAWTDQAIERRELALNKVPSGRRWYVDPADGRVAEPDGTWADGSDRLPNRHGIWTLLLDPAEMLRQCARDRGLLALHGGRGHSCPAYDYDGDLDEQARFYDHEVCPVVQNLAEAYGWKAKAS
ncbi:hypothetical protein ACGFZS_46920 [Streptomyces sp. NPDC048288]|uniref:hypothetical protein n=1 Tax=Streptomyces sp. NPDC048288 TaxID=3365529 RepID=UPI00371F6B90